MSTHVRLDFDALLHASYQAADGDVGRFLDLHAMAAQLGWDLSRASLAYSYGCDRGYFRTQALGGLYSMTVHAIDALEAAEPSAEKMKDRLEFLNQSLEWSTQDTLAVINIWEVGDALGWDRDRTRQAYEYLSQKGFLQARTLGGGYSITAQAVDLVTRADGGQESPSQYFPPLASLNITGGTIVGANIASPHGSVVVGGDITIGDPIDADVVSKAIAGLREAVRGSTIDEAVKEDVLTDVAALESQRQKATQTPDIARVIWQAVCQRVPAVVDGLEDWVRATLDNWTATGGT